MAGRTAGLRPQCDSEHATCPCRAAAYRFASKPVIGGVRIRLPPSPGEGEGVFGDDQGSEESARLRRALSHYVRHVDLGGAAVQPVLDDPVGYIAGAGHDKRILVGALLELLLIIANIGTAVVIVPIMRRLNEELAIGYVTARLFECTFILVGILCVLGIITLRTRSRVRLRARSRTRSRRSRTGRSSSARAGWSAGGTG